MGQELYSKNMARLQTEEDRKFAEKLEPIDPEKVLESVGKALHDIDAADYDKDLHDGIADAAKGALEELDEIAKKNSSAEHCIVSDNSGHDYVIPLDRKSDWSAWMEIPEDDERSWEAPDYADLIEGGGVIFKEYRLG